jgi:hypothetical protein
MSKTGNRTSKYLLYAIGEIILVVIGILIALQINNWNTERQNDTVRTLLLIKLDKELDYNIDRLQMLSGKYTEILDENLKMGDTLLVGLQPGNIEAHLKYIPFNASRLNLSSSTFEQMKNTGNLHTLSSDTLLNAIETYYKLCEREDFYILGINETVTKNTFNEINHGITKVRWDYYAKGLDYALKKNPWLLNTESDEYAEHLREYLLASHSLNGILFRIDRIIKASINLKELIEKNNKGELNTPKLIN